MISFQNAIQKKQSILVLTNDAGASENIAHLLLTQKETAIWKTYLLDGSPAQKIFTKLHIQFDIMNSVNDLNIIVSKIKPDIILYGTGWQVDFSAAVQNIIKNSNIKSIALIDHWTNYQQRFSENCLAKNIIVMDNVAKKIATNSFEKTTNIIQLENYFLSHLQNSYKSINKTTANSIVFISEPTSIIAKKNLGDKNAYGFTEYSALSEIIDFFDDITIRLHPSDDEHKYDDLIFMYKDKKITLIRPYDEDLVQTLSKSKLTMGFDGMALFISYVFGIDTISYLPKGIRKICIPIPKHYVIKNLKELKNIRFHKNDIEDLDQGSISLKEGLSSII